MDLLKTIRAVGRENRTKMRPVMTANPDHPEEDFDRDHDMTIGRGRILVAVAHRREGFDTEEKCLRKRARRHLGDGRATHGVEQGEERVEHQIGNDKEKGELGPGKREDPVIAVAPITSCRVDLEKFNSSGANRDGSAYSSHVSLMYVSAGAVSTIRNAGKGNNRYQISAAPGKKD